MTKKISILILAIVVISAPWLYERYTSYSQRSVIVNSTIENYIAPPSAATQHSSGLKFIILETGDAKPTDDAKTIVRSKSTIWVSGDNQQNKNEDSLDATDPIDLEASHPFLSEILKASSTGSRYLWWVDAELIPEGTAGFENKDTMIDIFVVDRVAPLPAPTDVASIPEYATITEDGIGYYLLSEATSGAHPTLEDMIEVHYSGWQTDGTMFDSSVLREKTNVFPLGRLIAGWQKSIPLMRVGEKARIWIPGDLAYDLREDRPHAPKGMLVFDVELVSIQPKEQTEEVE